MSALRFWRPLKGDLRTTMLLLAGEEELEPSRVRRGRATWVVLRQCEASRTELAWLTRHAPLGDHQADLLAGQEHYTPEVLLPVVAREMSAWPGIARRTHDASSRHLAARSDLTRAVEHVGRRLGAGSTHSIRNGRATRALPVPTLTRALEDLGSAQGAAWEVYLQLEDDAGNPPWDGPEEVERSLQRLQAARTLSAPRSNRGPEGTNGQGRTDQGRTPRKGATTPERTHLRQETPQERTP